MYGYTKRIWNDKGCWRVAAGATIEQYKEKGFQDTKGTASYNFYASEWSLVDKLE